MACTAGSTHPYCCMTVIPRQLSFAKQPLVWSAPGLCSVRGHVRVWHARNLRQLLCYTLYRHREGDSLCDSVAWQTCPPDVTALKLEGGMK